MTWILDEHDVEAIALGAGVLGTGGGGNPYLGKLHLLQHLRRGARIAIVPPERIPDDALGCAVGGMGAPTVGIEKLPAGTEMLGAVRALEEHAGRRLEFLACAEIGGANSMQPLIVAAQTGLPVADADPMGRAFPELQMDTFMIGGVSPSPFALCDCHGNAAVFTRVEDPYWAERLGRAVTVAMGGSAALAMPLLSGRQLKELAIPGTYTLARRLGEAVLAARRRGEDPVEALRAAARGVLLFRGKVVDVERRTTAGFARGRLRVEAPGEVCTIEFQNEFLICRVGGEVRATTPDLICIVDAETAEPVSTEVLRYGLRVAVLGLPAPQQLRTPQALAVVGPRAFGYDVEYRPLPGHLLAALTA